MEISVPLQDCSWSCKPSVMFSSCFYSSSVPREIHVAPSKLQLVFCSSSTNSWWFFLLLALVVFWNVSNLSSMLIILLWRVATLSCEFICLSCRVSTLSWRLLILSCSVAWPVRGTQVKLYAWQSLSCSVVDQTDNTEMSWNRKWKYKQENKI